MKDEVKIVLKLSEVGFYGINPTHNVVCEEAIRWAMGLVIKKPPKQVTIRARLDKPNGKRWIEIYWNREWCICIAKKGSARKKFETLYHFSQLIDCNCADVVPHKFYVKVGGR